MSDIIPNTNLTGYQQILLVKIFIAPETPDGKKRVVLDDERLLTAKNILSKLKIINVDEQNNLMKITDSGLSLMEIEGLIQDGELTELGQQLSKGELPGTIKQLNNEAFTFKKYLSLTS